MESALQNKEKTLNMYAIVVASIDKVLTEIGN